MKYEREWNFIKILADNMAEMGIGGLDVASNDIYNAPNAGLAEKSFAQAIDDVTNFMPCSVDLSEYPAYEETIARLQYALKSANSDDFFEFEKIIGKALSEKFGM